MAASVGERVRAGREDANRPGVAFGQHAFFERRHDARAHERRLAAARSAEDGQEARRLQLFDEALDVALAPEEEFGVLFVESLQAAVRADVVARLNRTFGSEREPLDGVDERLKAARVFDAFLRSTQVRVLRKGGS